MKSAHPDIYDLTGRPRPRSGGTPGVPMVISQKPRLDTTFSDALAARLAREYTVECIETLAEHMRDRSNPTASLLATKELLDRAYGKSKETKLAPEENSNIPKYRVKIEFVNSTKVEQ